MDKSLARLIRKITEKTYITNIESEEGVSTIDPTDIKALIREYYE